MSEDQRTGKIPLRVVLIILGVVVLLVGYCTFSSNRDAATMDTFIDHLVAGEYDAAAGLWTDRFAEDFRTAMTPEVGADITASAPYEIEWNGSGVSGTESYSIYVATGTTPDARGCVLELEVSFINGRINSLNSDEICGEE